MRAWSQRDVADLHAVITKGAQAAASALQAITGIPGNSRVPLPVPLSREQPRPPAQDEPCRAFYVFMPGGVFLVLFPVGSPFVGTFLARLKMPVGEAARMENTILQEVSNILVNGIANPMGDSCGMRFFLSAPRQMAGSQGEIVAETYRRFTAYGDQSGFSSVVSLESGIHKVDVVVMLDSSFMSLLLPPAAN